jgi:hypothetical protein
MLALQSDITLHGLVAEVFNDLNQADNGFKIRL